MNINIINSRKKNKLIISVFGNGLLVFWIRRTAFEEPGNFQRTIEKRTTKKNGIYYKISFNFHISLSYVDKELLYEIKEFLGIGILRLPIPT